MSISNHSHSPITPPHTQKPPKKRPFFLNLNNSSPKPDTRVGSSFWDDADVPLSPRTPKTLVAPTPTTPTFRSTPTFNLTPPASAKTPTRSTFKMSMGHGTPPPLPETPAGFGLFPPTPTSVGFASMVPPTPTSVTGFGLFPPTPTSPGFGFPPTMPRTPGSVGFSFPISASSPVESAFRVEIPVTRRTEDPRSPTSLLPIRGLGASPSPHSTRPRAVSTTTVNKDREVEVPPGLINSPTRAAVRASKNLGMNIWRTSRSKCKSLLQGKGAGDKDREVALERTSMSSYGRMSIQSKAGRRSSSEEGPKHRISHSAPPLEAEVQVPILPAPTPPPRLSLTLDDSSLSFECPSPSSSVSTSLFSSTSSASSKPSSFSSSSIRKSESNPPTFSLPPPKSTPPRPQLARLPSILSQPSRSGAVTPTTSSVSASFAAATPPRKSSLCASSILEGHINSRPVSYASHRSSLSATFSIRSSISGYSATVASASLIQLFPSPPPPQIVEVKPQAKPTLVLGAVPPGRRKMGGVSTAPSPKTCGAASSPPPWPLPPVPSVRAFILSPPPPGKKKGGIPSAQKGTIRPSLELPSEDDDEESDVDPTLYECVGWRARAGCGERGKRRWEKQQKRARDRAKRMGLAITSR